MDNLQYLTFAQFVEGLPTWQRELLFLISAGILSTVLYFIVVVPLGMERGGVAHLDTWLTYLAVEAVIARFYAAFIKKRLLVLMIVESLSVGAQLTFLFAMQGAALLSPFRVITLLVATVLLFGLPFLAASLLAGSVLGQGKETP